MRLILLLSMIGLVAIQSALMGAGDIVQERGSLGVEVGQVRWLRDHDAALKLAQKTGKPVFALFQEVPGCAGCQHFGKTVLSHAGLVKVIEEEFVPLLIYNNQASDQALLKKYREPAWNYQVVRFLNGKGEDLIPRREKVWELEPLAQRMRLALKHADRPASERLEGLVKKGGKQGAEVRKEAAFAMHCFWTGEMMLGRLDGVLETEAGWLEGREVTRVIYDSNLLSTRDLVKKAATLSCAEKIFLPAEEFSKMRDQKELSFGVLADGYRAANKSDQKKQIQGTPFEKLSLTKKQATKVNAWARTHPRKALKFLSPEQRKQLQ